ncbi:T9SS type A sorting domain-containing protein [Flavobacterium sp. SORGH_AS_0622]|uniref:T9SS type A sorting domain-containing protein n=1 Tax=Flavobacterium sp. SORGH_AS_0622 TaxID=3041772 RepID=UPI002787D215|nr:T9SS type A sorting domain-containing protein [Flavobacterium sp. SORGH_AS_0622]MDQ1165675.1 hypothetical protein [Flavobacterium sp. SORGH_AS_0622]
MKQKLLLLILLACSTLSYSQQKVVFSYDLAGNQVSRTLCLSGCASKQVKESKEIEALVEEDLQKFLPEDNFSYYPNPVKEELFLRWETTENKISSINVYGVSGQVLKSYTELQNSTFHNIPFQQYPTGVYLIVLNYKKGEQKTIKIIKQ